MLANHSAYNFCIFVYHPSSLSWPCRPSCHLAACLNPPTHPTFILHHPPACSWPMPSPKLSSHHKTSTPLSPLQAICSYLPLQTRCRARLVSRTWRRLAGEAVKTLGFSTSQLKTQVTLGCCCCCCFGRCCIKVWERNKVSWRVPAGCAEHLQCRVASAKPTRPVNANCMLRPYSGFQR